MSEQINVETVKSDAQVQKVLEAMMLQPPTLTDVLNDEVLREILRWHMIAQFAPEHFLFLDFVNQFDVFVNAGDNNGALATVREVDRLFCVDEALFELNMTLKQKRAINRMAETPPENLKLKKTFFKPLLNQIRTDLTRSLSSLWSSEIFKSYIKHRDALEAIHGITPDAEAGVKLDTFRDEAKAAIISKVREAYNTQQHVFLRRKFEVSSKFSYEVCASADNKLIGYAKLVSGRTFYFYDVAENLILKVDAVNLMDEKQNLYGADSARVSNGRARSKSCCGPAAPPVIDAPSTETEKNCWFLDVAEDISIPIYDAKLWWKYHVIDSSVVVKIIKDGEFRRVDEFPTVFDEHSRLDTVDPTQIL